MYTHARPEPLSLPRVPARGSEHRWKGWGGNASPAAAGAHDGAAADRAVAPSLRRPTHTITHTQTHVAACNDSARHPCMREHSTTACAAALLCCCHDPRTQTKSCLVFLSDTHHHKHHHKQQTEGARLSSCSAGAPTRCRRTPAAAVVAAARCRCLQSCSCRVAVEGRQRCCAA